MKKPTPQISSRHCKECGQEIGSQYCECLTVDQIAALSLAAHEAGDASTIGVCHIALGGDIADLADMFTDTAFVRRATFEQARSECSRIFRLDSATRGYSVRA